jgi:exodeoxyribonuclease VII large subunit
MSNSEQAPNALLDAEFGRFASQPVVPTPATVLSVSAFNRRAKNLIEAQLELLWVSGEVSNATRAASGHWYFTLKDDAAQVRCVLFRHRAAIQPIQPANGLKVEVRALATLYEARGEFQLGVENLRAAGAGSLYEAFSRLKARLAAEGLFDEAQKRPVPTFPRAIGIVTSPSAAALRDVLTTLARRAPMVRLIVYPTLVQGAEAPTAIVSAIGHVAERNEVDTMIVCRGGGSLEDLWSFNEEAVVRALTRLRQSTPIVTVSGIGHETDVTLADFAADKRAATPTAAAELASPDCAQLAAQTQSLKARMNRAMRRRLDGAIQQIDFARRGLLSPRERCAAERLALARIEDRLRAALQTRLKGASHAKALIEANLLSVRPDVNALFAQCQQRSTSLSHAVRVHMAVACNRLATNANALNHLDPQKVLQRGYGIIEYEGRILTDAAEAGNDSELAIRLAKGSLRARVTR